MPSSGGVGVNFDLDHALLEILDNTTSTTIDLHLVADGDAFVLEQEEVLARRGRDELAGRRLVAERDAEIAEVFLYWFCFDHCEWCAASRGLGLCRYYLWLTLSVLAATRTADRQSWMAVAAVEKNNVYSVWRSWLAPLARSRVKTPGVKPEKNKSQISSTSHEYAGTRVPTPSRRETAAATTRFR
jgi:hypothetical protein